MTALGLAVTCPPGTVPTAMGPCAPPGHGTMPSGDPFRAGTPSDYQFWSGSEDTSDATDYGVSSGAGGGSTAVTSYADTSSGSSLSDALALALGVGVVGLIAYWFYGRVA